MSELGSKMPSVTSLGRWRLENRRHATACQSGSSTGSHSRRHVLTHGELSTSLPECAHRPASKNTHAPRIHGTRPACDAVFSLPETSVSSAYWRGQTHSICIIPELQMFHRGCAHPRGTTNFLSVTAVSCYATRCLRIHLIPIRLSNIQPFSQGVRRKAASMKLHEH